MEEIQIENHNKLMIHQRMLAIYQKDLAELHLKYVEALAKNQLLIERNKELEAQLEPTE